jgi:hypothetical protein
VAAVFEPNGVLFGGTVLGTGERHTPQARAVLRAFNRRGDFDNLGDTADGLRHILEESFQTVEVDVIGSIAHFIATGPRETRSGNGTAAPPGTRASTPGEQSAIPPVDEVPEIGHRDHIGRLIPMSTTRSLRDGSSFWYPSAEQDHPIAIRPLATVSLGRS